MSKYNEYLVDSISHTCLNMNILKIASNFELNKNNIIRMTGHAVRDFLNKNKNVDYLIAYYYPTQEDLENNIAICYLKLAENIKNIDLSDKEIYKKLRWNEDYGFFSGIVKKKTSSNYRLVNEANKLLQIIEEAYLFLYDLWITTRDRKIIVTNDFNRYLEHWIYRAEHSKNVHIEMEHILKNDFMSLIRHVSNILYCCLSEIQIKTKDVETRRWIFETELANAIDKYEIIVFV